jgi:hypothetical protein
VVVGDENPEVTVIVTRNKTQKAVTAAMVLL